MQKDESSTRVAGTGWTQKPVLPHVRYHPTIQIWTPADGARPKNTETRTSQTPKTGPGVMRPPQTGSQRVDNTNRVNLVPEARLNPSGGPDQKVERARPRPEQVPLGLGVRVDRNVVEQVEVLTRGQRTNQDWFSWRKNRITASVAHRIAHCRFVQGKSKTPPTSYLAAITGEARRVQTRAMSWGVDMEAEAVRRYQGLKSLALARPITVQECGLFLDARRPWLAASPDGIVTDGRTGQWLLCLEVKCPYKHRERRVEDACRDDDAFCLQIQDRREPGGPPVYRLKTCHSYFTQIQCQLAVTGLRQADLVVFTTKETAIVPVNFDPELWEETVSRLEEFYRKAVLPRLRGAAAAWTPEL